MKWNVVLKMEEAKNYLWLPCSIQLGKTDNIECFSDYQLKVNPQRKGFDRIAEKSIISQKWKLCAMSKVDMISCDLQVKSTNTWWESRTVIFTSFSDWRVQSTKTHVVLKTIRITAQCFVGGKADEASGEVYSMNLNMLNNKIKDLETFRGFVVSLIWRWIQGLYCSLGVGEHDFDTLLGIFVKKAIKALQKAVHSIQLMQG